jgi:hypothetical protein
MKSFTEIKAACDLIDAALCGKIPGLHLSKKNAETFRTIGTTLFWVGLEPTNDHQRATMAKIDAFLTEARRLLDEASGAQSHPE